MIRHTMFQYFNCEIFIGVEIQICRLKVHCSSMLLYLIFSGELLKTSISFISGESYLCKKYFNLEIFKHIF